jgi:hypothetical protein
MRSVAKSILGWALRVGRGGYWHSLVARRPATDAAMHWMPQSIDASPLPRRVCIVNFTGERANWGCRASSWELVRVRNRHWPSDQAFALDVIPLLPHHALDREIPARYGHEIRVALVNPRPTGAQKALILELTRRRYLYHVDAVAQADLIVFHGEGTMTGSDFARAERLLLLPWVAKHVFGVPVVAVNQTLFSTQADFCPILAAALTAIDRVWVGESASQRWLREAGLAAVPLVADTAFLTDPLDHGDLWKTLGARDYFCITGSAALTAESVPHYLNTIRVIADVTGLFPVFVCSAGLDIKLPDLAEAKWPAGSFARAPVAVVYPAVAHCLGKARFLVGGRYHMSILAAIGGTPSVLVNTVTHKLAGLVDLLGVGWPIRAINERDDLIADAQAVLAGLEETRPILKARVEQIRRDTVAAFAAWYRSGREKPPRPDSAALSDADRPAVCVLGEFPAGTAQALLGPPQRVLPQLMALTVYLRRGVHTEATFRCLRQLIEGNLDLALAQLDSRWLVSICDSYADFGDPQEARNALLISSFVTWERMAETYMLWAEPERKTLRVESPVATDGRPLWDGLSTMLLTRGDTTNNLFIRYARMLEPTPQLLRIWRILLERVRTHDSVLAALNVPHGHIFDESLDWLSAERYSLGRAPWRREVPVP